MNAAGRSVAVLVDRAAYGALLAAHLDGVTGLRCVGVAPTVQALAGALAGAEPDVVVVDLDGGAAAHRAVADVLARWPVARPVVLADDGPGPLAPLVAAGAAAVLARSVGPDDLARTVLATAQGIVLLRRAALQPARRSAASAVRLTPRERQVLDLLAEGMGVAAVAARLGMSVHTCRGHLKRLMARLGAHSQLELVVVARRAGLLADGA